MPRYEGKLELTWTNKDQCLLAHEDGSYEWLPRSDYRIAEVRLLMDAASVGDVSKRRATDNLLIEGDALHALTSLIKLPEFREEYAGKVKTIYIDPPFNTGQAFADYDDALEHSVWLTMMRDRLAQASVLLTDSGSVWLHCDDVEQHRVRSVLDDEFGSANFVATIIWQKLATRDNRTAVSTTHDYIHVYAKDYKAFAASRNLLPYGDEQLDRYINPDNDSRGPWQSDNLTAKAGVGRRRSQYFTITTPSGRAIDPPEERCWLFTEDRFDEMRADNRIWFGENGNNVPRLKRFLSEVQGGLVPMALWLGDEVGTNDTAKKEAKLLHPAGDPFSTPKPEKLLERIISIATNPGDIVLDFFSGSGTTGAVAAKMGRRWVMSERSPVTIADYSLPRLTAVVSGEDRGGVSSSLKWRGGGGFRLLRIAPSMFEEEDGLVFLNDSLTNGALAEATAAQFGFQYIPEPPFAGLRGRVKLAVIDGVVNDGVVKILTAALNDGERVVICGTGIDLAARDLLGRLAPGSSLRKIPSALIERYRHDVRGQHALSVVPPARSQER